MKVRHRQRRWRWHVLTDFIKKNNWQRGAEIGVLHGKNLLQLLRWNHGLHMVGVDLFEPIPEKDDVRDRGGRSYSEIDFAASMETIKGKIRDIHAEKRCSILRGLSADVAKLVPDNHFDFVFIDADHTYEGVMGDILAWAPKVRDGGALMGHDARHKRFPGVAKALDEMLPGWTLHDDHVWHMPVEKVRECL